MNNPVSNLSVKLLVGNSSEIQKYVFVKTISFQGPKVFKTDGKGGEIQGKGRGKERGMGEERKGKGGINKRKREGKERGMGGERKGKEGKGRINKGERKRDEGKGRRKGVGREGKEGG